QHRIRRRAGQPPALSPASPQEATPMTVTHQPQPLTATPTGWVVEDVPAGTFRVHRNALSDEAVFQGEMRSIFDRCWLYVGHESEVPNPGDFRARDVGNRPLVFWHGHDGVKRVFYNS